MIEPSIDKLLEKAEDRFTLCILTAKRARQLLDGARCLVKSDSVKPVTLAVNEINANKIRFTRGKRNIK